MLQIPEIDWSKAPVQPGSPARAPSDGWKNWFDYEPRDVERIRAVGEQNYLDEWQDQAQFGLDDIAEAARRAGILDVNARLNAQVGRTAALYAAERIAHGEEIQVLDVGGSTGNTSLAVWKNLPDPLRRRARFTAIDLSGKSLTGKGGYIERMREAGATVTNVHVGSDLELLPRLPQGAYDIIVETAVRHQHGENLKPTELRYEVSREGGLLLAGDWHVYDMWKHPARVKTTLLPLLDFEGRSELEAAFIEAYPHATDELPPLTAAQERSNLEIARFWMHYGDVWKEHEDPERPKFRFIEGHRPAEDYTRDMGLAGYAISTEPDSPLTYVMQANPFFIRPESTLNALTGGIKPL